ncbi:MAG TPA: hypothetical protein VM536_10485, partial [Chloroflexia bacterium]|nr:hypothetical protein [Chloroflexia bacterium]
MNSSLISKIDKAKRYEREPERIKFASLAVTFDGENSAHEVSLSDNAWHCNCGYFPRNGTCSHVMAMQRILSPMLSPDARYGPDQGLGRPLP